MLSSGPGFQIARLTIKPLQQIASHWHRHRDEQWVVARGTAHVRVDGTEHTLGRGQAVEVPRTVEHYVENISSVDPVELIEVRTGDYLDADDVVETEPQSE